MSLYLKYSFILSTFLTLSLAQSTWIETSTTLRLPRILQHRQAFPENILDSEKLLSSEQQFVPWVSWNVNGTVHISHWNLTLNVDFAPSTYPPSLWRPTGFFFFFLFFLSGFNLHTHICQYIGLNEQWLQVRTCPVTGLSAVLCFVFLLRIGSCHLCDLPSEVFWDARKCIKALHAKSKSWAV